MQIVERSRRLLYLYTANVTESRHAIFSLTLVYEELLETSLSLHFSTNFIINLSDSMSVLNIFYDSIMIVVDYLFKMMHYIFTWKTMTAFNLINIFLNKVV